MMPSVCYLCDKDLLPNEGGLIYFSEDEEDRQRGRKIEQHLSICHSSNAFWFCKDHYVEAKKVSYLNTREALKILNDKFNKIFQNT